MPKTFSDHARDKLLDLYVSHSHEVGRELKKSDPTTYAAYKATDCITYALNVLTYAFEQIGDKGAASEIWKKGNKGSTLSTYLVKNKKWSGIYINPDVNHPVDRDAEHVYSNYMADKHCTYYAIPIKYKAVNYAPTAASDPAFQAVSKHAPATKLNTVDIGILDTVRFGFGMSRGGMHTWLFSLGSVYEVHWDQIGPTLYEKSSLDVFGWLSGSIVVPPDETPKLKMAEVKCP